MRAAPRVLVAAALALQAGTAAAAGGGDATGSIGDLLYPVLNLARGVLRGAQVLHPE
jgi:hypothetical protein